MVIDRERKIDPRRRETLQTIFYRVDEEIDAKDPDVQFDLVKTLNLNSSSAKLREERKAALDALIADLGTVELEDLHSYCIDRLGAFTLPLGNAIIAHETHTV